MIERLNFYYGKKKYIIYYKTKKTLDIHSSFKGEERDPNYPHHYSHHFLCYHWQSSDEVKRLFGLLMMRRPSDSLTFPDDCNEENDAK